MAAAAVGRSGELLFSPGHWQGLSAETLLILLRFRFKLLTVYVKNCKLHRRLNTAALLCNYQLRSRR